MSLTSNGSSPMPQTGVLRHALASWYFVMGVVSNALVPVYIGITVIFPNLPVIAGVLLTLIVSLVISNGLAVVEEWASIKRTLTGWRTTASSVPELRFVDLAVLLAGRKRAWSKTELLAGLAYSRHADHPSTRGARLYHAADLVRGAAKMRARDVCTALAGPVVRLRWVLSPTVPALLTVLGMALYYFATGGFAVVIDHVQDVCAAGGITGIIEQGVREVRKSRSR